MPKAKRKTAAGSTDRKPAWKVFEDWQSSCDWRYSRDEDGCEANDESTPQTAEELVAEKEWDERRTQAYLDYFEHPQETYTLAEVSEISFERPELVLGWFLEQKQEGSTYPRRHVDRFLLRDHSTWDVIEVRDELLLAARPFLITGPWLSAINRPPSMSPSVTARFAAFMEVCAAIYEEDPHRLRRAFLGLDPSTQKCDRPRIQHYHPALWRQVELLPPERRRYFDMNPATGRFDLEVDPNTGEPIGGAR